MVGFPRIRLAGATPGKPVILRYAEVLYPELPEHAGLEGTPMMENLRAALVHDIYYPKGGDEVIQPRFTFHGYRYVEISGIDAALPLSAVQGLVVSSVDEFSADYESSNDLVNRLWDNIQWSMRGNFLSIPTDTPARNERMGWSGDISVFARTANYMAHVNPFMTRHMLAMRDLQSPAGRFPDVAPVGGGFGGTLWGSAGVVVAWETYRQYGDLALLRDHYPAMVRYVDYLQDRRDPQSGALLEGPLGDWLSPEGDRNDNTLLWEAYNAYLLEILAKVASLLGEEPDATRFRQLHAESMAFFGDTYVDAANGRTVSSAMVQQPFSPPEYDPESGGTLVDTQASYAIPIALGVLDETNLKRAAEHLVETIERENVDDGGVRRPPYSLMTGFIGTAALGDALSMVGRDDLAYRLLQQTSYPSWLYPVQNGATTIWERLNSYTVDAGFGGNNSMNSFNHYAFGAIGGWMMSRSLGIRPPPDSAGYRHFILAPSPDPTGEMTWARGYFDSLHGRIESEWKVADNATRYRFVVPENTTATLRLPVTSGAEVKTDADVVPAGDEGSTQIYELGPGTFEFAVTAAPAEPN
jgi:alpha-L-rhamnosidase